MRIYLVSLLALAAPSALWAQPTERQCSDHADDDGDGLIDCADADCYSLEVCKTAGGLENSDHACNDFIDNDADGAGDCEDPDCSMPGLTACLGSWRGSLSGPGIEPQGGPAPRSPPRGDYDPNEGISLPGLFKSGLDKDGERNDVMCSDGVDNDGDGRADCADFGCQLDPSVTMCRGVPDLRFSVVASIAQIYDFSLKQWDTQFSRIQVRSFGPLPYIENSFFLLSMRVERTPRLTFARFQFPNPLLPGHFVDINSGGGGLSNGLIISTGKNPMLDPPFYLYSAFESGNGAALEFSGPIIPGTLDYRLFAAGGAGRFNGNVGGRFFNLEGFNYAYAGGAQLAYYALGHYDRWDTRFLFESVPTALTFYLGGRFDQREFERFPAANLITMFRTGPFLLELEGWGKRELEFESWQFAYRILAGVLIVPRYLYLSGDVGQFYATEFENPPDPVPTELRRQLDEFTWRLAAHAYVWRNTGILTLRYSDRRVERAEGGADNREQELRLEAQIRF